MVINWRFEIGLDPPGNIHKSAGVTRSAKRSCLRNDDGDDNQTLLLLAPHGRTIKRQLLPRVHRVFWPLKPSLLGTHQGAAQAEHIQDYLDQFAFPINRRKSRSRGKAFYRLAQCWLPLARKTASLHRKRLAHDSFKEVEMWLRGVFD